MIVRQIPLGPDAELRVRALEDASGNPVIDLRIWRKAPDDLSDDPYHPTVQGLTVPLAMFSAVLDSAWKVQRMAAAQAAWRLAAWPTDIDMDTRGTPQADGTSEAA